MSDVTTLCTGFAGSVVPQAEHDEVLRELVHMRGQRDAAIRDLEVARVIADAAEGERDAAIARAERAEWLCVALADTLGHSCALPDGLTMFAASCHYMESDWREQVEAMRARLSPAESKREG